MSVWEERNIPVLKSGSCGKNCTWALNDRVGMLVISGSGPLYTPWEEIEFPDYHDDYHYYNVSPWGSEWGSSMLHTLIIEDGVTAIDARAFACCTALEQVQLPETLESIGDRAFDNCSALKTLVLPDRLSDIQETSIQACSALTHLYIGARTRFAREDQDLFLFCKKLREITVSAENPYYICRDGILYARGASGEPEKLLWCSAAVTGTVRVPDTVKRIGGGAFCAAAELEKLYIPDSVTEFGGTINRQSQRLTVYVEKGSAADLQRERIFAPKTKVRYESGFSGFFHK